MGNPIASHDIYCAEKCSMGVNETLNELLICIVMLRQLNFGRFLHLSALSGRSSFVLGNAAARVHRETPSRNRSARDLSLSYGHAGYWRAYSENFFETIRFVMPAARPACQPPGMEPFQPNGILAKVSLAASFADEAIKAMQPECKK